MHNTQQIKQQGRPGTNILSEMLRRQRSKKHQDMKESHPPSTTPTIQNTFKSYTDIQTSDDCNNSSENSSSCLELRILQLTDENRQLRQELEQFKRGVALQVCNSKLLRLVEETECLADEITSLRKQLDDSNIEKDFYMRAYNTVKKDNETMVRELTYRRKEIEILRGQLRKMDSDMISPRKRTSSQSPKNISSLKVRQPPKEGQSLQDLMMTLRGQVQKASSLRYLQETLKKLESKLDLDRKPSLREVSQRRQYFPECHKNRTDKAL